MSTYCVVLRRNKRVKVKQKELHAGGSSFLHQLIPDGNSSIYAVLFRSVFWTFFPQQRLHGFVVI